MVRTIKGMILSGLLVMTAFLPWSVSAQSTVPPEFYANYDIQEEYNQLLDLLVKIQSQAQTQGNIDQSVNFRELHSVFVVLFPHFPQLPDQRIIYENCISLSDSLAADFTYYDFSAFLDHCFAPLQELMTTIRSKYTVKPRIEASPRYGAAPMNVTLDARGSSDPSNDTIPERNYYWYYKDSNGDERVIGRGPVVNYTFQTENTYIVHLTVRSSNAETQGVFDGSESIAVTVDPKAANIVVYANGKKLDENDIIRLGSHEAEDGILIDGTATTPIGQRTIVEHEWRIRGEQQNQYSFERSGEGPPTQFFQQFIENGIYTVTLQIIDNEGNRVSTDYKISVSDPVAHIRHKPDEGTTSTDFTFDASASYSITSRVNSYQWIVTDPEGNQVETLETKEFTRRFRRPGIYTVKLTVEDEFGNISYDTEQIEVGSTPPVPSYTVTSTSQLEHPSRFMLDASATFDEDVAQGADSLIYDWSFSLPELVEVVETKDNGRQVEVIFLEAPTTYKVQLRVEDSYGEVRQIEKDVRVESTLRPEIVPSSVVTTWGQEVTFGAVVNKDVSFYQRDFGDGTVKKENTNETTHRYEKSGIYPVKLFVANEKGETNEVTKQIFVGQRDQPVIAYEVKEYGDEVLTFDATCEDEDANTWPAYQVNRYQTFLLDASQSVNTQGKNIGLITQFRSDEESDRVFTKSVLNYDFKTVGCHYIDIFVDDKEAGKTVTQRVWFHVTNALPELQNLVLNFPQPGGGETIGIGTNIAQDNQRELFNDPSVQQIVVRLQAKGARDPDGFISHYLWRYYPSDDPERIMALKVTPSSIPYTTFVIPKTGQPASYSFALKIVDNDEGEVTSEEVLGKGPTVFFPPSASNVDIPIVTLIAQPLNVNVGEEVTLTTEASTLLGGDNPAFAAERYFKYDFEGDGENDLTTKKAVVTHSYQLPGDKRPKVTTYYRGRAGVAHSDKVVVQEGLTPLFVYDTYDTKMLVKQMSAGALEEETICMDIRKCRDNPDWEIADETFMFDYGDWGDYFVVQTVVDEFGNREVSREKVEITQAPLGELGILSIPAGRDEASGHVISVGNSLDNTIDLYLHYPYGNCYGDVDVAVDSDGDGDPVHDEDVPCNQLSTHSFFPQQAEQQGRIYYVQDETINEIDLLIEFIDYEQVIPDQFQRAFDRLKRLIAEAKGFDTTEQLDYYTDLLVNLQASLGEEESMDSILIQLRDFLASYPSLLPTEHKQSLMALVSSLSDETVQSVFGGTVYDTAKTNVLFWFPPSTKEEAVALFEQFEAVNGNQEEMKAQLDQIFTLAAQERDRGNIDDVDFNDIKKNLCDIVVYYELPSKTCGTLVEADEETPPPDEQQTGRTVISKILRIVLIVLGIGVFVFAVIVVLFAIKAKRQQQQEEQTNEETTG